MSNDKCRCQCTKHYLSEKHCIWNSVTCSCENGKYLANIIDDSLIECDEITEETKAVPTNFDEKKYPVKHKVSIF